MNIEFFKEDVFLKEETINMYGNLSLTTRKSINSFLEETLTDMVLSLDSEEEERCESVIEEMMYINLQQKLKYVQWFFEALVLNRQYNIGKYRADILIACLMNNGKTFNVVIECDGHEYHNKDKKQVQRDKERDRYFVAEGYLVLRFTGSEIVKNVDGCTNEVLKVLSKVVERMGGI